MKYFITGGAGFIGSNLTDRLLKEGHKVTIYDNFSTGKIKFIKHNFHKKNFKCIFGDIVMSPNYIKETMKGCDFVFHLAANADIRHGVEHPNMDLHQNTIGTFNVLEAMRLSNIKNIAFSSTGSVYGETIQIPTPEDAKFPVQTSLYGASKLAGEGLIEAYCEAYGMKSWIFRFVSQLGKRYTHGHVYDFYKQLQDHPKYLNVMGDGTQRKSYLNVKDCIDGMLISIEKSNDKINIFNLGTDEYIEVNDSVKYILQYMDIFPEIEYSGGKQGWIGDIPFIFLDCTKIKKLGWKTKYTIKDSIEETLKYLINWS